MEKKVILQIFASRTWGGGEQYVYDLSEQLVDNGDRVLFLSKRSDVISKKIPANLFFLPLKGLIDLYSPFKLRSIVKKHNVDIVHIHQFKDAFTTGLTKLLLGGKLKVVLTRHLVKKAKTNFIYGLAYKSIDKIIFVSELAKNVFLNTKPNINSDKITVLHNSIPNKTIVPFCLDEFNIPEGNTILSFIGRLDKEKGIEILIRAISLVKNDNISLIIAGTGNNDYKTELESLVKNLGLSEKIIFIGFVDNVLGLIQKMDIGILSSIVQEACPIVVMEYMKAGKPIIATNNGAQKEFVENNVNGILIPPNNAEILANEIESLISDKQKANSIGQKAAQDFNDNFNYDKFFKKILDVYNNI